ncbi:glucose 1-dehydrogenase [Amycolatopsis minnesotensis]|uniref:SDR family NAD(P)-dependent oxidoreductase n=1 Tax=Amycolatopsis minnesotensis TaxID=337894 RepID=UPI0031DBE7E7
MATLRGRAAFRRLEGDEHGGKGAHGMPGFELNGKNALVTGGARGIGKAIVAAFLEAGANVVIGDRDEETGTATAAELGAGFVRLDVTDSASLDAAVAHVAAELGSLDVHVNNAGTVINKPAVDTTDEEWRRVLSINLDGVFFGCRAAAKRMLAQDSGGSIVNIGSMSGHIANHPQPQASYNASKAGVIHLTKSLAAEWARGGVRVNSISPGYVGTELTKQGMSNEDWKKTWLESTPMGRVAEPSEIAPAAVFLASGASSYFTGSDLVVDGGYTVW